MAAKPRREPPVYQRIADDLRAKILSGDLKPGDRIPGENKLIETYSVSRMTARAALVALREAGLAESRRGSGFYVRAFRPIRRNANKRASAAVWGNGKSMWTTDLEDRPMEAIDVQVEKVEASEPMAHVMELPEGAEVWRRSRTYEVEKTPVLRSVSYLPAELVEGSPITQADTGPGGTYARLADLGHAPARFREEVQVRMPRPDESEALSLTPGTPVVLIIRTAFDKDGRVVEINEMWLDSSRFILEYDFTA